MAIDAPDFWGNSGDDNSADSLTNDESYDETNELSYKPEYSATKPQVTNREYKDSVFRKLFNEKRNAIELYNAIEGTHYREDTEVIFRTLDGTLYFHQKNDLAFQIDGKFVIICEHQSSINLNMPLRILPYISDVYDKTINNSVTYGEKLVKIPTPKFVVLYNGKKKYPKETTLRLSDSYEVREDRVSLELEVRVININYDRESEILAASPTLNGYSILVEEIRNNEKSGMSRDEAIDKAIGKCIKLGILTEFLRNNWKEVFNMLHREYSYEDDIAVKKEEGRAEGRAEGEEMAIQIMKLLIKGKKPQEIAILLNIPQTKVENISNKLAQT